MAPMKRTMKWVEARHHEFPAIGAGNDGDGKPGMCALPVAGLLIGKKASSGVQINRIFLTSMSLP